MDSFIMVIYLYQRFLLVRHKEEECCITDHLIDVLVIETMFVAQIFVVSSHPRGNI